MGLMRRRALSMVLVGALAASLVAVVAAAAGQPRAWIDAPLPGSTLSPGPVTVTVHGASAGGIKAIRFLVDAIPTAEVAAPPGDLVTVAWTWAADPGEHLVSVVAVGADGLVSTPAAVAVTVGDLGPGPTPGASPSPGPTRPAPATATPGATAAPTGSATPTPRATPKPTAKPTPKPTPRPTPKPTPRPCEPPPPTLLNPINGQIIGPDDQNPPTFRWRASSPDCNVTGFHLHVWNNVVGYEKEFDLSDNSWTPANPLPDDPSDPWGCAHYQWQVWSYGPGGDAGELATDTFRVSPDGHCGP